MQMPDKKSLHAQKCVQANSRKRRAAVQWDGAGPRIGTPPPYHCQMLYCTPMPM